MCFGLLFDLIVSSWGPAGNAYHNDSTTHPTAVLCLPMLTTPCTMNLLCLQYKEEKYGYKKVRRTMLYEITLGLTCIFWIWTSWTLLQCIKYPARAFRRHDDPQLTLFLTHLFRVSHLAGWLLQARVQGVQVLQVSVNRCVASNNFIANLKCVFNLWF